MAKVLVVGGAGYIGSHTAKQLARRGHSVSIIDNLSTGFKSLAKYGTLFEGSILDRSFLQSSIQAIQPEMVFHFAAKAIVAESVSDPALYYRTNVEGTLNLLDCIRELDVVPGFIFSSTCSVYGVTDQSLTEQSDIAPMNPYAKSKRMIEEILFDYEKAFGLRYYVLRYFNAAGSDSEGELGELHSPETHLIPILLLHCIRPKEYPVRVFGNDYPTTDGTCIRDYIHVEDLAAAHIAAMEKVLAGQPSDICNLGTTQGHSVLDVIRVVEKVTGVKILFEMVSRRAGDPPRLVSGSHKARQVLHWIPKHGLESIVSSAWRFVREHRA